MNTDIWNIYNDIKETLDKESKDNESLDNDSLKKSNNSKKK